MRFDRKLELETRRLQLGHWQAEDWLPFRAIATDPDVVQYIGTGETWSDDRVQAFVRRQIEGQDARGHSLWPLFIRGERGLAGFCGLQPLAGTTEIEIGWWLDKSLWGHGYASEAAAAVLARGFETLGLARIVAVVQPANARSRRVADKIGMRLERTASFRSIPACWYVAERPAGR